MNGLGVLDRMGELTRSGETFALATVVWRQGPSSSKLGSRAIITGDGHMEGWIGGACAEPVVIREAKQVMANGEARLVLLGTPDQFGSAVPEGMTVVPISCQSEGALEVYIEPVFPVPHLVVVGRSPMTQTLAGLGKALGWNTDLVSTQDFAEGAAGERSMVVVATQGHGDEDMIERAVRMHPAYLGLVASRKRAEAVLGYLVDRGVPKAELDKVHAPAGLDLGRTAHEEMAVAILAELVQLRASSAISDVPSPRAEAPGDKEHGHQEHGHKEHHGRNGHNGHNDHSGHKEHIGHRRELQLAEAVDPVCGMTVAADASSMPFEHDGRTYYFCCAGCRQKFKANPDAYIKAVLR